MNVGLSILATAMLLSFTFGCVGMVYDVMSKPGLSDRASHAILILYLWPLGLVGAGVVVTGIALIWGVAPWPMI